MKKIELLLLFTLICIVLYMIGLADPGRKEIQQEKYEVKIYSLDKGNNVGEVLETNEVMKTSFGNNNHSYRYQLTDHEKQSFILLVVVFFIFLVVVL